LPAVDLGPGQTARSISAGSEHTCAVLGSGAVKCWGANDLGQIGLGDTQHRGDGPCEMGIDLPVVDFGLAGSVARSVVAGPLHTCAILTTGEVFCWGNNQYGQLGLGDTINRGDGVGDRVAASILAFGPGRRIAAIAAGYAHTCALDSAGAATCWGQNRAGQLGLENRIDWSEALNPGDLSVHLGGAIAEIALGSFHSCARFATGVVKCWGLATFGQLGLGATDDRGDDAGEMGDVLPAVDLGRSGAARALSLVAGGDHDCAVLDTGDVKCWGLNQHGELGIGDTKNRGVAPDQMGDALPAVAF
jgi:E3 ubiquitin-protein ligase HERC3